MQELVERTHQVGLPEDLKNAWNLDHEHVRRVSHAMHDEPLRQLAPFGSLAAVNRQSEF